eukprot:9489707-Pyramimonas_sp.AAC.1
MAVAVLVALGAYLRPGELCGPRVRDVVPPALGFGPECQRWSLILGPSDDNGDPTKTGVHDDNVTLDHDNLHFIGDFFERYRRGKQPKDPLWHHDREGREGLPPREHRDRALQPAPRWPVLG